MPIETTGQNADGYSTVNEADQYAIAHFTSGDRELWDAASPTDQEAAIRQATQYIDSYFRDRFPGRIRSTSQALEWPRVNAYDRSGRNLNDIPRQVKQATAELAKERIVADASLVPSQDRGGAVKRERVEGVVEVEYMDDAPGHTTYAFAERLLSAVLVSAVNRVKRA